MTTKIPKKGGGHRFDAFVTLVAVAVGVFVGTAVLVAVAVGVLVGIAVLVAVAVKVLVGIAVLVAIAVKVFVGTAVFVAAAVETDGVFGFSLIWFAITVCVSEILWRLISVCSGVLPETGIGV